MHVRCYVHKTILVKLIVKPEDKLRLQATFSDYKIAWQYVSDWIFKNKTKNRTKVHHSNRRRFSVPLSEFVRILEYKARFMGKQVVKVKPHFTSQDDCRGLERGERIGGKYIGVDGVQLHSDINAACNIALRAKQTFKLDNLVSVFYHSDMAENIKEQGAVNHPIVDSGCKGNSQASMVLA